MSVMGTASAVNLAQGGASLHASAATPHTVQAAPKVPKGAKSTGAVSDSARVTGQVVLKPRDENAVKSFIANVTNKKSPEFHHYLSTGAYGAEFGPTAATINATAAARARSSRPSTRTWRTIAWPTARPARRQRQACSCPRASPPT
jgi:subtilase family serine protease